MICSSCGNEFLQPFVCTTCGAQKLHDETVRVLEKENAALREEIRELNQMGFTYENAAAQKAAMAENAAKHDSGHKQWFVYGAKTMTLEQIEKSQQEEKNT
jgi:hypothetical protein